MNKSPGMYFERLDNPIVERAERSFAEMIILKVYENKHQFEEMVQRLLTEESEKIDRAQGIFY